MDLKQHIRSIPDFPKPGILFYDISTLLASAAAWSATIQELQRIVQTYEPDLLAGIESRGFLMAAPLSLQLGIGFTMVRKQGKLPGPCGSYEYELEYGTDILEIQEDAVKPGQKVVLVDDLLATGGTMAAAVELLRKVEANVVASACIIELEFLKGREKLDIPCSTLVSYNE